MHCFPINDVFVVIFPIFDFDILRCFSELIASPRSPENCIASPHRQQSQISPGSGAESLESASSQASCEIFGASTSNLFLPAGVGGGCKKCTQWIWKRSCFKGPIEKRPPRCLANQKKRNSLKKCSYYSFIVIEETNKESGFQKSRDTPRDALRLHHTK